MSKEAPPPRVLSRRERLNRELTRIRWRLHCEANRRRILSQDLDNLDRRVALLRRQLVDALEQCGEHLEDDAADVATADRKAVRR